MTKIDPLYICPYCKNNYTGEIGEIMEVALNEALDNEDVNNHPVKIDCDCGTTFSIDWDYTVDDGEGAWVQNVVKFDDPNQTELPNER